VGVERLRRCRRGWRSNRAPWAGSTGLRISAALGRAGRYGGELAGPPVRVGLHQITYRSGSGNRRVATDGGVLLARAVDPSPRRVGRRGASPAARRDGGRQPSTPWPPPCPRTAALARPPDPPQPVELRRQRPGAVLQILQVAVAVERPAVDAARPAAPVAGLRDARTGVVGLRPAGAPTALVDPRSGRDGDLPGPARLPAAHQASPPLACCQAPTTSASRRARPSRSRMARAHRTPRRWGPPDKVWVRTTPPTPG